MGTFCPGKKLKDHLMKDYLPRTPQVYDIADELIGPSDPAGITFCSEKTDLSNNPCHFCSTAELTG